MLFFIEDMRKYLPNLFEHLSAFPLLTTMRAAISTALPGQVSAVLVAHDLQPRLEVVLRESVAPAFVRACQTEILAGYRLFTRTPCEQLKLTFESHGAVARQNAFQKVGSLATIPLVHSQRFVGILLFAAAAPAVFDCGEIANIAHWANHLARVFPDLAQLHNLAVKDELTGLDNRRSFEMAMRKTWLLSQRYHYPIGLLMMDLNGFKSLNDDYGHLIGDIVLKEFADILKSAAGQTDILARYGGDEFAVILTDCDLKKTQARAERILKAVAKHVFVRERQPLSISISIGVANSASPGVNNAADLLALADRACYQAKERAGGAVLALDVKQDQEPLPAVPLQTDGKEATIMVIDDEPLIGAMFQRVLTPQGFNILSETSPRRALERIRALVDQIDIVVIDFMMPEMNGLEVIQAIKQIEPGLVCMILTGYASMDYAIQALRGGAYDFIQKPVQFEELTYSLRRGIAYRRLQRERDLYRQRIATILQERTAALQDTTEALEASYMATLEALTATLQMHEPDTILHDRRVASYAEFIARRLHLPDDQVIKIRRGALLHDIGKIGVPDSLLQKNAPLTAAESVLMRQHPTIGWQIIKNVPFLQDEAAMIVQHHEHFDGSGYPHGLAGAQIEHGARIFAVADAFDALISDRAYRKGVAPEAALEEIRRHAGTQFDPEIVNILVEHYAEMLSTADQQFDPQHS